MQNDFIITLAWPEGMVKAAGAWYDNILSQDGEYRVGHSAIALINSNTKKVHYFDFGRYHTPEGYGRVRDIETDQDTAVIDAEISENKIANIEEILLYLSQMKATHAEGKMYASFLGNVDFKLAFNKAKGIQKKGMLPYGPLVRPGTNCSRFVAKVINASGPSVIKKLRLKYPFCISPSPKRNVCITNHHYYVVENNHCIEVKKSRLEAYFTSIEG
ncbi:hypothetical protein N9D80_02310 [Flavobacteriales bacterium]|nr:hypothetical protein [Flavobacteriales bacterium]